MKKQSTLWWFPGNKLLMIFNIKQKKLQKTVCLFKNLSKLTLSWKLTEKLIWETEYDRDADLVEHVLGSRSGTLHSGTTGGYDQVAVTDTFIYKPILETLKFLYGHPNIEGMMAKSNSRNNLLKDSSDGDIFKSHLLFPEQSLSFRFNFSMVVLTSFGIKIGTA